MDVEAQNSAEAIVIYMAVTGKGEAAYSRAMVPGDELHLSLLMAPHGLNLVTGQDRLQLLAYARDVWQDARALPAGMEPFGYVRRRSGKFYHEVEGVTASEFDAVYTAAQVLAMGRVPPGWQITEDMHIAAVKVLHRASGVDGLPQRMVDAMLAAAPRPPAAQERKPLTDEQIREWWASENGLEDCDMGKLVDFTTVVREVEAKLSIEPAP